MAVYDTLLTRVLAGVAASAATDYGKSEPDPTGAPDSPHRALTQASVIGPREDWA